MIQHKIRENNQSCLNTKYGTFIKLTRENAETREYYTDAFALTDALKRTTGGFIGIMFCLFDLYFCTDRNTTGRILAGVACLMCSETIIIDLRGYSIDGVMRNHIINKHVSERVIADDCIITNYHLAYRIAERDLTNDELDFAYDRGYDIIEEFKNMGIYSYMCYFCDDYYGATPSAEISFSHLKKCSYLRKFMNKKCNIGKKITAKLQLQN